VQSSVQGVETFVQVCLSEAHNRKRTLLSVALVH
jgi:hypothetical protein